VTPPSHPTGDVRPCARADLTDAHRLITEQVYRRWPLRDALAYAPPGVREVRVETVANGLHNPFGGVAERSPLAYDGEQFRMRAVEPGTETPG
jgi:hypothetical protein